MALRPPQFTPPKEKPGFMDYLKQGVASGVGQGLGTAISAPIKDLSRQYIIERPRLEQQQKQFESELARKTEQSLFQGKTTILREIINSGLIPSLQMQVKQNRKQAGGSAESVTTEVVRQTEAERLKQYAETGENINILMGKIEQKLESGGLEPRNEKALQNELNGLRKRSADINRKIASNRGERNKITTTTKRLTPPMRERVLALDQQFKIMARQHEKTMMHAVVGMAEILFPGDGENKIAAAMRVFQERYLDKQQQLDAVKKQVPSEPTSTPPRSTPTPRKPTSTPPRRRGDTGQPSVVENPFETEGVVSVERGSTSVGEAVSAATNVAPEHERSVARKVFTAKKFKNIRDRIEGLVTGVNEGSRRDQLVKAINAFNNMIGGGGSEKARQLTKQLQTLSLEAAHDTEKTDKIVENLKKIQKAMGSDESLREKIAGKALTWYDNLKPEDQLFAQNQLKDILRLSRPSVASSWAQEDGRFSQSKVANTLADQATIVLRGLDAEKVTKLAKRFGVLKDSKTSQRQAILQGVLVTYLNTRGDLLVEAVMLYKSAASLQKDLKSVVEDLL